MTLLGWSGPDYGGFALLSNLATESQSLMIADRSLRQGLAWQKRTEPTCT